jgi:copper(I)-binding protein
MAPCTHRRPVLALAAIALLAACGSSTPAAGSAGTATSTNGDITVTKAWVRTATADNTAAYFTIMSKAGDTLTAVSVDPAVATSAQLHQTMGVPGDTAMAGATTMAGAGPMTMAPLASLELPPGQAIAFQAGGYHVMVNGLLKPLTASATVTLTLTLAKAGPLTVKAPVRDVAP